MFDELGARVARARTQKARGTRAALIERYGFVADNDDAPAKRAAAFLAHAAARLPTHAIPVPVVAAVVFGLGCIPRPDDPLVAAVRKSRRSTSRILERVHGRRLLALGDGWRASTNLRDAREILEPRARRQAEGATARLIDTMMIVDPQHLSPKTRPEYDSTVRSIDPKLVTSASQREWLRKALEAANRVS